jgi:hypothetical protein
MTIVPLAEYAPDLPAMVGQASDSVLNCLARTAVSYGPMPSLSTATTAITARCQGAFGTQDTSGNVFDFCGDATHLYKAAGAGSSFSDVSKAANYTTGATERWSFTYFNGRVLATNFGDAIQSFVLGSSTLFADLAAAAPKARYITGLSKGFVAAANTYDPTSNNAPQRVWWCGFGDATSWPTPGSNAALAAQSDYQDLTGDHGWCMGIVGNVGMSDAVVFFERAVFRMVYTGGSTFFQFAVCEGLRGTPAPGSIAQLGAKVFFLGEDGFYVFDGQQSAPIGAGKVDKTFLADVDTTYLSRISSAVDPLNKIVFWAYPGSGHSNGNPNNLLAYNWDVNRWTRITSQSVEFIFRSLTLGYTLEQLDAAFGSNIDVYNFSLDDRSLTGGKLLLSGFDTSHRMSNFNGLALAATIDSQEAQITPGRRSFVTNVRPIVDGATPTVALGTRDRQTDSVTWAGAVTLDALGNCPQRSCARYQRARIAIPAASTWTHVSAVDVEAVPEGYR